MAELCRKPKVKNVALRGFTGLKARLLTTEQASHQFGDYTPHDRKQLNFADLIKTIVSNSVYAHKTTAEFKLRDAWTPLNPSTTAKRYFSNQFTAMKLFQNYFELLSLAVPQKAATRSTCLLGIRVWAARKLASAQRGTTVEGDASWRQ